MSIIGLILRHVFEDGPVSFDSICQYVREHHAAAEIHDWEIAAELTEAIRNCNVTLSDSGKSFYMLKGR